MVSLYIVTGRISSKEQLEIDLILLFLILVSLVLLLAFAKGEDMGMGRWYNNETLVMTEKETVLFDAEDRISCEEQAARSDYLLLFFIQFVLAFADGEKETGLFNVEDRISSEQQVDIDLVLLFPILVFLVLHLAFAKGEEERSREEHLDNPAWSTV